MKIFTFLLFTMSVIISSNQVMAQTSIFDNSFTALVDISAPAYPYDWNEDGHIDIVSDGSIYLNDGTDNFELSAIQDQFANKVVDIVDLNGDNLKDIVTTKGYAINNGDNTFDYTELASSTQFYLATGDMNGDGFVDIVGSRRPNAFQVPYVYYNDGSGNFTSEEINVSITSIFTNAEVLDWDENGELDIITIHPTSGFIFCLLQNNGVFTREDIEIEFLFDGQSIGNYMQIQDIDADGDKDIVLSQSNDLIWIENQADVEFTIHNILEANFITKIYDYNTTDLNNDGFIDFIFTYNTFGTGISLGYIIADENGEYSDDLQRVSGSFSDIDASQFEGAYETLIFTQDFNQDGKIDLVAYRNNAQLGYYANISVAAPVAAFEVVIEDTQVTFSNNSTDASTYSWDFGDGNTSTDSDPSHEYEVSGTYTVCLTAVNEAGENTTCQDVTVVMSHTSAPEFANLQIYPNPVQDEFIVQLPATALQKVSCTLQNVNGVMLLEKAPTTLTHPLVIRVQDLPAGVYFLKLLHQNGAQMTQKIVLQP